MFSLSMVPVLEYSRSEFDSTLVPFSFVPLSFHFGLFMNYSYSRYSSLPRAIANNLPPLNATVLIFLKWQILVGGVYWRWTNYYVTVLLPAECWSCAGDSDKTRDSSAERR